MPSDRRYSGTIASDTITSVSRSALITAVLRVSLHAVRVCLLVFLTAISAQAGYFFDGSRGFLGVYYDTVGYKFSVGSNPIAITKVGILDNIDDGLASTNQVGLWDANGTLILNVEIPQGTAAPVSDHYRWITLPVPLVLPANAVFTAGAAAVGWLSEYRFSGQAGMPSPDLNLISAVRNNNYLQPGSVISMPTLGELPGQALIGANFAYVLVPAVNSSVTAIAPLGETFYYQITATNSPASFSASGLPAGLNLNPLTGIISGTPTIAGSNQVVLTASKDGVSSAPVNLSVFVIDPLDLTIHSADTNRDGRISLLELTRAIELFNTHNGTRRTGCYKVDSGSEDGFNPDFTRLGSTVATLATSHSGDSNRDGKFSLLELTRVIELYNTRSGGSRTGQYRALTGTEDGFSPAP